MIKAQDFNKRLLQANVSIREFARLSGRNITTIKKFSKSGVPDKDAQSINGLLKNAEKPIFFGEQTALKDI